jgi:hypothetical protein
MRKILKTLLIIIAVALISIQFIRPSKNKGVEIAANQITAIHTVPEDVQQILKVSCYDCHSNTTYYPWYDKVQPVAWFLEKHVIEGKKELNFSEFANYPVWRQYKKFKEIGKEIKEDEMPLSSYTLIHRDAVLDGEQKLLLQNWVANILKDMEQKYPADSLARPK